MEWCNDDVRHGVAFALLIRDEPFLLKGHNRLWIRFFLLAVYATMYIRDHRRPVFHEALGLDPKTYDREVFELTTEISRQVFPIELDIDNPKFFEKLEKLRLLADRMEESKSKQKGLLGRFTRMGLAMRCGLHFAGLYFMRTRMNRPPVHVRLEPVW